MSPAFVHWVPSVGKLLTCLSRPTSHPWSPSRFLPLGQFSTCLQQQSLALAHLCVCAQPLQSCPTLCDPMDHSPPGSSVHGFSQARILEWLPCTPPGEFPVAGIKPASPTLQADSSLAQPLGSPEAHLKISGPRWALDRGALNSSGIGALVFNS